MSHTASEWRHCCILCMVNWYEQHNVHYKVERDFTITFGDCKYQVSTQNGNGYEV